MSALGRKRTYHSGMPSADASLSSPNERLATDVDRSLSLDALIDQAWRTLESSGEARHEASAGLCSLSLDHGRALRLLIGKLPPSAIALLRPQYEGLVRAVWARHCASEADLQRLFAELTPESQQAAKRLPGTPEMLDGIGRSGPRGAQALLGRARVRMMDSMNSNAMSMLTLLVLAELSGDAAIVELVRVLHVEFEDVLPELEPFGSPQ